MSKDDTRSKAANGHTSKTNTASLPKMADKSSTPSQSHALFRLPRPIKQIFDKFPLKTYPSNELPQRALRSQDKHILYVFITDEGARQGHPSYNPACLKWQIYLRISGINHTLVSSNNHASPTGALPFLLPASSSTSSSPSPVPTTRLQRWIDTQTYTLTEPKNEVDLRTSAYLTLLDHRIRPAYLHSLYLSPRNFESVASPLYIESTTSSSIVQGVLSSQLRGAAFAQITKSSPGATTVVSSEDELYTEARLTFSSLSMLLSNNEWFFAHE